MKTKRSSRKWVVIFILEIIGVIIGFIISALLAMIPVVGWIITILGTFIGLGIIFGAIKHLLRTAFSHACLTETGIRGIAGNGKRFKLSFENIDSIQQNGDYIIIKTNIKKLLGGYREYWIESISNSNSFIAEYKNASAKKVPVSIEAAEETTAEESK